jgi:uncharacterized membrane protein
MADKQLVLGIFDSEQAADKAVADMSDLAPYAEVAMSDVGVLVVDENGKLKQHKMGQRRGGKGAGIGLVLAAVAPPALIAGIVGGAVLGHFSQRGASISQDDQNRLAASLAGGKAAVGIMVAPAKANLITEYLADLGATIQTHDMPDEALDAAAAADDEADTQLT